MIKIVFQIIVIIITMMKEFAVMNYERNFYVTFFLVNLSINLIQKLL